MPTTTACDPLVAGPHRCPIERRWRLCALRPAPVAGRPQTVAPAGTLTTKAGAPSC